MQTRVNKPLNKPTTSAAPTASQVKKQGASSVSWTDQRPEAVAQRKLRAKIQQSARNESISQLRPTTERDIVQQQTLQKRPNNTGLPDRLKNGMENLSGINLDHVKVHYNSPKPAAVQAHAYAQGSDIHLASGQEKHLPHELSHVVQQAQGRVKPTTKVNGMSVNDNPGLEKEADVMGIRALNQ